MRLARKLGVLINGYKLIAGCLSTTQVIVAFGRGFFKREIRICFIGTFPFARRQRRVSITSFLFCCITRLCLIHVVAMFYVVFVCFRPLGLLIGVHKILWVQPLTHYDPVMWTCVCQYQGGSRCSRCGVADVS